MPTLIFGAENGCEPNFVLDLVPKLLVPNIDRPCWSTDAGKDLCQGDSGGPLICNVDDKATLSEVVSRGVGCAEEGYPGIYGSTFEYLSWMERTIRQN